MGTRVGIELSPSAWRIVEIDEPARRHPHAHANSARGDDTRVRSFASVEPGSASAAAALAALRGRSAAVVVWNAANDYREVQVADGRYDAMRAAAIAQLVGRRDDGALSEHSRRGLLADVAPLHRHSTGPLQLKRLALVAADAAAVRAAIAPISAAGVRIVSVATPAMALLSLARMRRSLAQPDDAEMVAYVALDEWSACAVLVRNSTMLAVRNLPWGYLEADRRLRPRLDVAERLGTELQSMFASCPSTSLRTGGERVRQVCICGGLSDLRSTAMPLMKRLERFDVEVEPLDSLFSIDAAQLPERADEFRERACELRMAWAIAADTRAPLNLLRHARQRSTHRLFERAAVVAGIAAGLGGIWTLEAGEPAVSAVERPVVVAAARPAVSAPQQMARVEVPAASVVEPPVVSAVEPPLPPAVITEAPLPPVAPRKRAAQPKPPAPSEVERFDAALTTILYAPDRRIAIIDGQIVEKGDTIKGAHVVEITPSRVLLRDSAGRDRQLKLPPVPAESVK